MQKLNRKSLTLLICVFILNGCTDDVMKDLLGIGAVSVVGYGVYKASKDSSKNTETIPDCRQYYQNLQGCCSYHGGVAGCYNYYVYCIDGTVSPTCKCVVPICIYYQNSIW